MLSERIAIAYAPTNVSSNRLNEGRTNGSAATTTTAHAAPIAALRRVSTTLDAREPRASEQSGGTYEQREDDDGKRDRQTQVGAHGVDVRPEEIQSDAEDEPADNRAGRAVGPAEPRRRERVYDDALHHVRIEEHDRRDHDAGHGAHRGRKSPAEREHPAHADAERAALRGILCCGAHREPELRAREEQIHEREHRERHGDNTYVLRGER